MLWVAFLKAGAILALSSPAGYQSSSGEKVGPVVHVADSREAQVKARMLGQRSSYLHVSHLLPQSPWQPIAISASAPKHVLPRCVLPSMRLLSFSFFLTPPGCKSSAPRAPSGLIMGNPVLLHPAVHTCLLNLFGKEETEVQRS